MSRCQKFREYGTERENALIRSAVCVLVLIQVNQKLIHVLILK